MSETQNAMKELSILAGEPITVPVTVNGKEEQVVVKRIKVGHIPKLLNAAGPAIALIMHKGPLDLQALFLLHSNECLDMLTVLTDKPRAFVDELDLDQGVELLASCLEVNMDFFVQKVLPRLLGVARRILGEVEARKGAVAASLGQKQPNS